MLREQGTSDNHTNPILLIQLGVHNYRLNSPVVSSLSVLASMRIASKKCRPIKLSLPNDMCSNIFMYIFQSISDFYILKAPFYTTLSGEHS